MVGLTVGFCRSFTRWNPTGMANSRDPTNRWGQLGDSLAHSEGLPRNPLARRSGQAVRLLCAAPVSLVCTTAAAGIRGVFEHNEPGRKRQCVRRLGGAITVDGSITANSVGHIGDRISRRDGGTTLWGEELAEPIEAGDRTRQE